MPPTYESPFWRFLVTDNVAVPITLLDRLASNRSATFILNGPAQAEGYVPSDSPEINILHTDGFPFLAEGVRYLYGFRREVPVIETEWVCRFAGIIEIVEDDTRTEDAQTHYTAYDPWRYWYSLVLYGSSDADKELPGGPGFLLDEAYFGEPARGDLIAATLLGGFLCPDDRTLVAPGAVLEHTPILPDGFWIPQGTTLGEAVKMLTDTGTIDIVLKPIWDRGLYPDGTLCEYNIYAKAGVDNPAAVFAWDMPSRSLTGISDLFDGTQRANNVIVHYGQGGPPVHGADIGDVVDTDSVLLYRNYYAELFASGTDSKYAARQLEDLAFAELALRKDGKRTVTSKPAPERSPIPFVDYNLGDRVPIYASSNLRQAVAGVQRVYGFNLVISDDALETVDTLLVVGDTADPPGPPPAGAASGGASQNLVAITASGGRTSRVTRRASSPTVTTPFKRGKLGAQ